LGQGANDTILLNGLHLHCFCTYI